MTLLPLSNVARFVAAMWALACTAVHVSAYVQREIHDMPEAALWLTIILTFPAALIGIIVMGWISYLLADSEQLSAIQQFWSVLPCWAIAMVLGYFHWFVAVPRLWQKAPKPR